MRKLSIFIILFFCLLTVRAQQVSLQDVANRTYRAEGIRGIKPMLARQRNRHHLRCKYGP